MGPLKNDWYGPRGPLRRRTGPHGPLPIISPLSACPEVRHGCHPPREYIQEARSSLAVEYCKLLSTRLIIIFQSVSMTSTATCPSLSTPFHAAWQSWQDRLVSLQPDDGSLHEITITEEIIMLSSERFRRPTRAVHAQPAAAAESFELDSPCMTNQAEADKRRNQVVEKEIRVAHGISWVYTVYRVPAKI